MDRSVAVSERSCIGPRTQGDDLGADRYGCLLGRASTDINSDRRHDPSNVIGIHALGPQAFDPALVRTTRAHGTEIADLGLQGAHEGRDIELVVVGEHAYGV